MRKTKVIGFSVPPELHAEFEKVLKGKHKTKSEFFRELFLTYFNNSKSKNPAVEKEENIANVLRTYWDLRGTDESKTIIIGLGIIVKDGRVLIGARKDKDKWVENLSWVFPGGRLTSLNFEDNIKEVIKEETNLDVKVKSLVASRIHPDSGFKDVQVVALYFYCEPSSNVKEKGQGDLKELKWVKPREVFKYFTTSVTDEVTKFLMIIEKSSK